MSSSESSEEERLTSIMRYGDEGIPKPGPNATAMEKMQYTVACCEHERLCLSFDHEALLNQQQRWRKKKDQMRSHMKTLEEEVEDLEDDVRVLEEDKEALTKELNQNITVLGMVEDIGTKMDLLSVQIDLVKDNLKMAVRGIRGVNKESKKDV